MFLGISAYFHDSSVALIDNKGNLIDFKKEEWLSRVKGDKSFPRLCLEEMIKNYSLSKKNITAITFYEKPVRSWLTIVKDSVKRNSLTNELTSNYFKNAWQSSMVFYWDLMKIIDVNSIDIYYSEHHLSHTLSSLYYYNSPPYTSIVVDGYGDKNCTSIHLIKSNNEIINLWNSDYPHSLGLFYSAITDFLGFAINEGEYKMMGLASYGSPRYYGELSKTIKFENNKLIIDTKYFDFVKSIKKSYSEKLVELLKIDPRKSNIPLIPNTNNFKIYADIASSAQKITEDILFKIFEFAYNKTKVNNFLFSGGVAMNSSAVRKLGDLEFVNEINIPPSPGDSGAAVGAAFFGFLKGSKDIKKETKLINLTNNFFPGKNFSYEDFYTEIFEKISDKESSIDKCAELIANNEIIATCYDNIETGPRALGNRSLICTAHNKKIVTKLNEEIKKRSPFRPTAPAVLSENVKKYFKLNNSLLNCYYHMAATAEPIPEQINKIEGVVHVDKTSRIQICKDNQLLGKILKKLISYNIFVVANTSFNISSDPMVYDKEDAYLALKRLNLQYLLTENGLYKLK